MTVCAKLKNYSRHHERMADLFSLLAVALLSGSIWIAIEYQPLAFEWIGENAIIHGAIVIDVTLIFVLLNLGSARFSKEDNDSCFHTFRGRRHGTGSLGSVFRSWVHHMEHVNKKHR